MIFINAVSTILLTVSLLRIRMNVVDYKRRNLIDQNSVYKLEHFDKLTLNGKIMDGVTLSSINVKANTSYINHGHPVIQAIVERYFSS